MDPSFSPDSAESRIAEPTSSAVLLAMLFGVIGAGLAAAGPTLASWSLHLEWIPFGGPLRLLRQLGEVVPWWILGLGGLLVGVVAGLVVHTKEPVVTVSDRAIVITRGEQRTRVVRSQVSTVAIDEQHLVLRDHDDVELVYQELPGPMAARVATALDEHRWRP